MIEPIMSVRGKVQVERTATGWRVVAREKWSATLVGSRESLIGRVASSGDRDVVQLASGDATSRLCNAVFNAERDEALVFKGDGLKLSKAGEVTVSCDGPLQITVLRDYVKVHRNLAWFRPLDRSRFPKAPSGWSSWFAFDRDIFDINEKEILRNTDWLAEHLKPYGCDWVQIDDGWQGRGGGFGTNRDWFKTCRAKFPSGMKACADYIRSKGLRPGIWCVPFSQSNTAMWKRTPRLFVHRADGGTPGDTTTALVADNVKVSDSDRFVEWFGRYVIDPTGREGQAYLRKLFRMLCDEWGYDFVKIDGQGWMPGLYGRYRPQLCDPTQDGDRTYRMAMAACKDVMGPDRFLLNCGHGWSSVGQCEGIRTGPDAVRNWTGFTTALDCTYRWLWMNTLAFYTDPDMVCVSDTLPYEQARAWSVLLGITGQMLQTSEKMYALGADRLDLLRRIFPVADIRPMEFYPLDDKVRPSIFDLKVARPAVGTWDVVACFNWSEKEARKVELTPAKLGLEPGEYLWLDVFRGALLEAKDGRVELEVPPTASRVVSVWPIAGHPQFVGSDRHLTQGLVDVESVTWDARRRVLCGESRVVANDPCRIRIHVPGGYAVATPGVEQYGRLAVLTLRRERSEDVKWEVAFKRQKPNA